MNWDSEIEFLEDFFKKAFGRKNIECFEGKISLNCGKNFRQFLAESFFLGILISLFCLSGLIFLEFRIFMAIAIAICAFFAPLFFGFFFQNFLFERNKIEMEKMVPDVLLAASAFPHGTSFEEILQNISPRDFGLIGKEFEKALLEIRKGSTVESAFESLKKRNKSRIIDRTANLLVQGYNSGAELNQIFRETAEDLLETNAVLRDRASAMIVEKYTLLLAGGFIVPLVLGLLVGLVSKMNFFSFGDLNFGMSLEQRRQLFEASLFANQIYLFEYALLSSAFAAFQENDKKNFILYAVLLVPLGFAVYNIAKAL